MVKQINDNHESAPKPPSLLVAAHCATLRRKATRIDVNELSSILNDCVHEAYSHKCPLKTYLNSLNEIVTTLSSNFPSALLEISSHYFFTLVRNTVQLLLSELHTSNELNNQEIYILRNCTVFIYQIAKKIDNVSKIIHWITEETFLDTLANCLIHINKISKAIENEHIIKQITRLLNIMCHIQQHLPINLHQNLFARLLQPTITCLTSENYFKLFSNLQAKAGSLTESQKLFLIKCPYFLTGYNGPCVEKAIEHVLEIMLPRYVSILDKHMKTIKEWRSSMMRAIHNLIITIVYADGYFSSHTHNKSFRLLINHLLCLLSETSLIKKIHPSANNLETLLIDATLVVFSVLVYEPNALDYIKKLKPIAIFRQLTTTSHETIVLSAYMMLVYVVDENDIERAVGNLSNLLSTTLYLLGKEIETRHHPNVYENSNRENNDRNIIHLLETLKGLAPYEQIQHDILKYRIVSHLMYYYEKLHGLSKKLLLECFWTLSFNEQIAQQLREQSQFILSLDNILRFVSDDNQQNTIRPSSNYYSRQNGTVIASIEGTNNGIREVADGLLWKLVNEPEFRENIIEKMKMRATTKIATDTQNYKYDIMISYCCADKDIVHKIQNFLTNEGYNVWFDSAHNHRNAMEVVADAIENSQFVILCMSDSYKRNNNCKAEAEYAFNSKRLILPLIIRTGYKPKGWLASMINNSTYIDFAGSDFKTASTWLLEKVKQQQCKREIPVHRSKASTLFNIAHNSSVPSAVSNKSHAPVESLTVTGSTSCVPNHFSSVPIDKQQQMSPSTTLGTTIADVDSSIMPDLIEKQQKKSKRTTLPPPPPPPMVSSIPTIKSIGIVETEQAQTHTVVGLPTSSVTPSTTSNNDMQQQPIQKHFVSPSTTSRSMASTTSDDSGQKPQISMLSHSTSSTLNADTSTMTSGVNKQYKQHKITDYSISQPPTFDSILSIESFIAEKQQKQHQYRQQQRMAVNSVLQSATASSVSSNLAATVEKQQQRKLIYPASTPLTTTSITSQITESQPKLTATPSPSPYSIYGYRYSTASNVVEKQQSSKRCYSVSSALTPASSSSDITADFDDKRHQKTTSPVLMRSTSSTVFFDASCNVEIKQQQAPVPPKPRTSTINAQSSIACSTSIQQQQQTKKTITESFKNDTAPPVRFITIDNEQQQPIEIIPISQSATSSSIPSDESISVHKQPQQQTLGYFISCPPITTNTVLPTTSTIISQPQQLPATHLVPQSLTNNNTSSASTSTVDKLKQKTQLRPISQSQIYDSIYYDTSVFIDQQPQLTQMYSASQPLTNNTVYSDSPIIIDKLKQKTQIRPVSQLQTSDSVPSDTSVRLDQHPQKTPMQPISQSIANNTVSSASPIVIDKLQQNAQLRRVAQSQITSTFPSVPSDILDQQPQLTAVHNVSQQLKNNKFSPPPPVIINKQQHKTQARPVAQSQAPSSASSATSVCLDQQPKVIPMHFVSQPSTNGTVSSALTTITDKQQQKKQVHPISQSQACDSVYSGTSVHLDEESQWTSMHLVPELLANDTVAFAAVNTMGKQQQKTQVRPVSQSQISGCTPSATHIRFNQQPHLTQMHCISKQLSNNTVYSDSAVIIDELQEETQIHPVSQSQTYESAYSNTSVRLDQEAQWTSMHIVPELLTNDIVASASVNTIEKQRQKKQVQSVRESQTYDSGYSDTSIHLHQEAQWASMHLVPELLANDTVVSASINTIGKQQQQQQQQKTQIHTIPQSQTYDSGYSDTSTNLDQEAQWASMHLVPELIANDTVVSASVNTIGKQQQKKTQAPPVPQSQTSSLFPSASCVRLDQQPQLTQMYSAPQMLTNNTVYSDSAVIINELQEKTQIHPVSQSQMYGSAYSGTSASLDRQSQLTQMHTVSQQLRNNTVSSDSPVIIDELQKDAQIHPVSQSPTYDSVYCDTSVDLNQEAQLTPMYFVSEQSTNNTVSSAPIDTVGKQQQKTQVRPVSQSHATYVHPDQQAQRTPMHFVSPPSTNNTASSALSNAIDKQEKIEVCSVAKSETSGSDHSALFNQQLQSTAMLLVSEPSTHVTVCCALPVATDKRQQQRTQVPLVSQCSVARSASSNECINAKTQPQREVFVYSSSRPQTTTDTVLHNTSTVDKQPQQVTSKHNVSQSSANPTTTSVSHVTVKKQQQESPMRSTSRSQVPTSSSSALRVDRDKQEGMASVSNSKTHLHSFEEPPRLPTEYTNRKTMNSTYRTVPINLWKSGDVLDFLFDLRLYDMMPLCESMSGKALIRLFRMCQEKPKRLYNQLNEELRIRFKGLTLPMGVYAEFLIEMDDLVGLVPATVSEIPCPKTKDEEHPTFRPLTVQEEPISMQRSSRPIIDMTVSRSLSHSGIPVGKLPGRTASNNIRLLERSFVQPPSAPGRPYMLILESIEESTVLLQ
ncbi:unnamed protein product [Rotaria sp. Silwood1]|nr:unnamed protein product [Rotaria sp. Silwood1]CAF0838023.1 unnamed protein product [Rotaria sp. Silwood1]CAF3403867.1 unnamed protein product [Rotaria sp. Silwood1]CAF4591932.1 unnamed protein product [Rotaria sp. Silwood1]